MTAKLARVSRDEDNPTMLIIEILHETDQGDPIYWDTVLTRKPVQRMMLDTDLEGRISIRRRWRPRWRLVAGEWEQVDLVDARMVAYTRPVREVIADVMIDSERRVRERGLTGGFVYEVNREADADADAVVSQFRTPDTTIEPARRRR